MSPKGTVISTSGAAAIKLRDQRKLHRRIDGHVEQEERERREGARRFPGGLEERGSIGRRRRLELLLEPFEQPGEVRTAERQTVEGRPAHAGEHQLMQRARQRAGEAGCSRDRREVLEAIVARCLERGPRRDRLAADERDRGNAASREHRRRQPRRELGDAEAVETDRAAARHRHRPREVVRGTARGGHDQHARGVRACGDPGPGFGKPLRCVGCFDEAERGMDDHDRPFPRTPCRVTGTAAQRSCEQDDNTDAWLRLPGASPAYDVRVARREGGTPRGWYSPTR